MADFFNPRDFLDEPSRPAQVAAVSPSGLPLLGSLWFAFEHDRFWFNSQQGTPLQLAANREDQVAVIVDDFTPPDRIVQVRVRGRAVSEPHEPERVFHIYRRYLGRSVDTWPLSFPERMNDPAWTLWTVSPDTGLVADYRDFAGGERRWRRLYDCPLLDKAAHHRPS